MESGKRLVQNLSVNYSLSLVQSLNDQRIRKVLTDCVIEGPHRIHECHRSILASASPVFEAMMTIPMSENQSGVIKIKHFDDTTIKRCLDFIYTGRLENPKENFLDLYYFSDEFQISGIKKLIVLSFSKMKKIHISKVIEIQDFAMMIQSSHVDVDDPREKILPEFDLKAEATKLLQKLSDILVHLEILPTEVVKKLEFCVIKPVVQSYFIFKDTDKTKVGWEMIQAWGDGGSEGERLEQMIGLLKEVSIKHLRALPDSYIRTNILNCPSICGSEAVFWWFAREFPDLLNVAVLKDVDADRMKQIVSHWIGMHQTKILWTLMKWLKVSPKATMAAMEELLVLVDFKNVGLGAGSKLVTLANQFSSIITYFDLLEAIKARMSRCRCGGRFDCKVHQLRAGPYKESDVVLKWLQLHWEFAISNDISALVGFLRRGTIPSEHIPTYLSIPSVRQNSEVMKMFAQMDLS